MCLHQLATNNISTSNVSHISVTCGNGRKILVFSVLLIVNFLGLGLPPPGGRIVNHLIFSLNFLISVFFQITTLFFSYNIDHNSTLCASVLLVLAIFIFWRFFLTTALFFSCSIEHNLALCASVLLVLSILMFWRFFQTIALFFSCCIKNNVA